MQRRLALRTISLLGASALAGCGFRLRTAPTLAFQTLAVVGHTSSPVAQDIIRQFGSAVVPLVPTNGSAPPQVVLDVMQELRERRVVAFNSVGQVRELQISIRLRFSARTPQGRELIAESEISQQRDISFNETLALAKEAEEAMLFRDMQSEVVLQLQRRLAAIRDLDAP